MALAAGKRMDLLLWRHAEAEDSTGDDLARRLSPRGFRQAKAVGRWLFAHQPKSLRILVSPAVRAVQTAEALGLRYEINPKLDPSATAADLIAAAGWPLAGGAVLLVGHQPTLGRLAASVLFGEEWDLMIKKGGLWWFAHSLRNGQGETVLKTVIAPSLLRPGEERNVS
jgi:phosphohistidine phosphatase